MFICYITMFVSHIQIIEIMSQNVFNNHINSSKWVTYISYITSPCTGRGWTKAHQHCPGSAASDVHQVFAQPTKMNNCAQLLVLTDKIMNYRGTTALFLLLPWGYHKFFTIPMVLPWNPNFPHLLTAVLPQNYRFPHYRVTLYCSP